MYAEKEPLAQTRPFDVWCWYNYQQTSSDACLHLTFLPHKASVLSAPSSVEDNSAAAYNSDLTAEELQYILQHSRDAAPRSDNFRISFLHNSPPIVIEQLLQLFNSLRRRGNFSCSWKRAIVLPLPKTGKNPSQVDSHRPISLTSTLGKLYEKNHSSSPCLWTRVARTSAQRTVLLPSRSFHNWPNCFPSIDYPAQLYPTPTHLSHFPGHLKRHSIQLGDIKFFTLYVHGTSLVDCLVV